jgi:hypothetical protein
MTGTTLYNFQEGSFLFCKLMKSGSFYLFQNSYAMLQSHNNYSPNKSHVSNSGADGLNIYIYFTEQTVPLRLSLIILFKSYR